MGNAPIILILEAMVMYFLVLGAHSLRHRFGLAYFYALIGGITAIMSWVTDAGLLIDIAGITFVIGSTVFYTALLLGVFVIYVFDGPKTTRIAITTVIGVSIMMPAIAAVLHLQSQIGNLLVTDVPQPSLRINTASVIATFFDLIFLGIAWEFLGKPRFRIGLWMRTYLTLLGVMWFDVIIFSTGAFAGTPDYFRIMQGTLVSRFIISLFVIPFLYGYLYWQSNRKNEVISNRPVLTILNQVFKMELELSQAQQEIARRKKAEVERDQLIGQLRESRERYKQLSEKLRKASITDELTGIPNRRFFNYELEREWKRATRENTSISVVIFDIDHFKEYNDNFGHIDGDTCLKNIAQELATTFNRPTDIFARYGGDEFVAILPDTEKEGALTLAEVCRQKVDEMEIRFEKDAEVMQITISAGVSTATPEVHSKPVILLNNADNALYEAKNQNRNSVRFTPTS